MSSQPAFLARCIALALVGVALATPAAAQEPGEDSTRLERELSRPGRFLVERRTALPPVGLRGGATIVAIAVRAAEPGREQERILGVRVELRGASPAVAHLDVYEIDNVVRALDYMAAQTERGKLDSADPTELRIQTVDALVLGAVVEGGRVRRFVQVGDSPRLAADAEAFARLRERLDQARRLLFAE